MATNTLGDFPATIAWSDVVDVLTGASGVECVYHNIGASDVYIVFGGASAPVGKRGHRIASMDSFNGNAANVWVRSIVGSTLEVSVAA